jgi:hypothetical protein
MKPGVTTERQAVDNPVATFQSVTPPDHRGIGEQTGVAISKIARGMNINAV